MNTSTGELEKPVRNLTDDQPSAFDVDNAESVPAAKTPEQ